MKKKKMEFSKKLVILAFIVGFIIIQECLVLIGYAIHKDFTATAAYLTAAVAVGEVLLTAGLTFYLNYAKALGTGASDKQGEGITYAAAVASNFDKEI